MGEARRRKFREVSLEMPRRLLKSWSTAVILLEQDRCPTAPRCGRHSGDDTRGPAFARALFLFLPPSTSRADAGGEPSAAAAGTEPVVRAAISNHEHHVRLPSLSVRHAGLRRHNTPGVRNAHQ